MALSITTGKINEVAVVRLTGVIFFGEESALLRLRLKELVDSCRHIVLDLGGVTHIDSGGLGTLVGIHASAKKLGGEIKLANLCNHPQEVMQITKLVTIFEIFGSSEDAAASFKKAPAVIGGATEDA